MTEVEAQRIVTALMATYPGSWKGLDEKTRETAMAVYRKMLADLDYEVANAAVARLIAECKWLPTVAEIRAAAIELSRGTTRPGGEAWGDVLTAVGKFGRYREPSFDDPIVARIVNAFGWVNLCDSENQVADRARFIELYDQLAASDRREALSGQLPAVRRYRELRAAGDAVSEVLELGPGDAKEEP